LVAGGVGVAATATVLAGWPAPASAATPTAYAKCTASSSRSVDVTGWLTGFEPSTAYRSLLIIDAGPEGDDNPPFVADVESPTDENGYHDIAVVIEFPTTLPVEWTWSVYLDANGDKHYQQSEEVYGGTGTLTSCPQTIALSPK
jgi:hypothetical protein